MRVLLRHQSRLRRARNGIASLWLLLVNTSADGTCWLRGWVLAPEIAEPTLISALIARFDPRSITVLRCARRRGYPVRVALWTCIVSLGDMRTSATLMTAAPS